MAGFGHEGVQPVSVNAPPLVAPAAPVATGSAVEALVQSFRNGVINADDVSRVLSVNPLKDKAEIQGLNEMLSPAAIAARKSGVELQGVKATRELADTKYGGGVSAYQQYAPYFGKPPVINNADGTPDYDAMGQAGAGFMGTMAQQNFARMQLEPDVARNKPGVDPKTRQKVIQQFNKWGEEVTPGSPRYTQLMGIINQTNDQIFGGTKPGTATTTPVAAAPSTPALTRQNLTGTESPDELRAKLASSGLMPMSEASKQTPDEARSILESFNAKVPPAPAPVIEPAAAPTQNPFGSYIPGVGMVVGPSENTMAAPDIATDLRKQPQYELWAKAAPDVQAFLTTADKIRSIPDPKQRAGKADMNTLDMDLAERIIKMEDPGNAIREFKWDKLVEGVPLYDRLKNFKAEALRTGAMTPEKRKQLISLGEEVLAGRERAVKPLLELAKRRAAASGATDDQIFTSLDQQILAGGSLVPKESAHSGVAAPHGELVTIPGRGTGYLDRATGMFTPK